MHRALVLVESNALTGERNQSETVSLIITDSDREQTLELSRPARLDQFLSYVNHGMFHIAIGFDHILFLIALLLAAPLRREARQWRPSPRLRPALVQVISVVTLVTVAHSITLALAALGIVNLPSSLVEAVIALTVVAAAVHNLVPLPGRRFLAIIFVFGLFHGFGFASVLADLGLSRLGLVTSLLGFNIGVELGQLLLVLVAFPALYLVRGWPHYKPGRAGGRVRAHRPVRHVLAARSHGGAVGLRLRARHLFWSAWVAALTGAALLLLKHANTAAYDWEPLEVPIAASAGEPRSGSFVAADTLAHDVLLIVDSTLPEEELEALLGRRGAPSACPSPGR